MNRVCAIVAATFLLACAAAAGDGQLPAPADDPVLAAMQEEMQR
jgi:hypothetical protein